MAWRSGRLTAPVDCPAAEVDPQIDRADQRHGAIHHPSRHLDQRELAAGGMDPTLQRRRRRTQHQRRPLRRGAGGGHVAGVIPRGRLLLERALVLLVQDDQAQVRRWGEDRAAGPDHHRRPARGDPLPVPMPLGVAQMAVQDRHLAETQTKPLDRLRREADLRHQDNRLPPVADHFGDRLNIDLGLAAAGHAVDEDRLVFLCADRCQDDVQGALLIRVERQVGLAFPGGGAGFSTALDSAGPRDDKTLAAKRVDRGRGASGRPGQLLRRHRLRAGRQRLHHRQLLLRQLAGGDSLPGVVGGPEQRGQSRARLKANPRRQHRLQHLPPIAQIPVGDPLRHPQHRRR